MNLKSEERGYCERGGFQQKCKRGGLQQKCEKEGGLERMPWEREARCLALSGIHSQHTSIQNIFNISKTFYCVLC